MIDNYENKVSVLDAFSSITGNNWCVYDRGEIYYVDGDGYEQTVDDNLISKIRTLCAFEDWYIKELLVDISE
jgi:hypothetical protein